MNKKVLLTGSLLSLPVLVFLGISFRFDPRTIDSPLIGKTAPGFALEDLDGNRIDLAALRGKPVLLNFWATWCQPCIVEHPVLQAAARRYADRVHFLGVIYQDENDAILRFLRQRGSWGPSLVDPDVKVGIAYGVYGAPETFFIDSSGIVAEKVTGPLSPGQLDRILGGLL
ncbi:MAG: redoxin domain-containing protein [Acidobacteriota bacterium]|nr:redoxin domain-containing protein [Acidobacteriota bacterium]